MLLVFLARKDFAQRRALACKVFSPQLSARRSGDSADLNGESGLLGLCPFGKISFFFFLFWIREGISNTCIKDLWFLNKPT